MRKHSIWVNGRWEVYTIPSVKGSSVTPLPPEEKDSECPANPSGKHHWASDETCEFCGVSR